MKKIIIVTAALICITSLRAGTAYASEFTDDEPENGREYADTMLEEQYHASGADRLSDVLPDGVRYRLSRAGIELNSGTGGTVPDTERILSELTDIVSGSADAPLGTCAAVLAVILIYSLIGGVYRGDSSPPAGALGAAVSAALCCVIAAPAAAHIAGCADELSALGTFVQALLPVVSAIMLASGQTNGAAGFSAVTAPVSGIIGIAAAGTLLDGLRVYLALACVSSVSDILKLDGLLAVIEKNIKWALTFTATVYLGVLAVVCSCSSAADRAGNKAFKLIVSGSVPVIGGAVSDALGTLQNCVGILRSSVGGFALLAAAFIIIPPVIRTVLWRLALELCAAAAAVFDAKQAEKLLHSCAGAMDILLSFLLFFAVLVIGSLACVLGGGT